MELREITGENYQQVLDLSTGAGQEEFVAQNVRSLAHAWVSRRPPVPMPCMKGKNRWASSCLIGGRRKRRRRSGGL